MLSLTPCICIVVIMQLNLIHSPAPEYQIPQVLFSTKLSSTRKVLDCPIMDPLSGIASVLSVADVAVRSCERLRDLISDLRDAPQSVQRLRRTIQNTESVVRNVWLFVSEFNSSALATVYHEILPEAVERCLEQIRDDLNLLENILAPDDSSGNIWKRMGHVWRKKAAEEIARRLDSQQSTLSLALQSAAEYVFPCSMDGS